MVACAAGGHQIVPAVLAAQPAGDDVVQRELGAHAAAILAGVIVAAKDFLFIEFHIGARAAHHAFESNDGWCGEDAAGGVDLAAAVCQHGRLIGKDQAHRAADGADIERFVIRVEDEDGVP